MVAAGGRAAGSASDSNPGSRVYPQAMIASRSTLKWLVRRIGGVLGHKTV
jgi:hypothetical protein